MAQETHVCRGITIFAVDAIELASETQPLQEVARCARTASGVSGRGARCARHMTGLTHLFSVGPEPSIALVFT
jgi:hypothetical protein